MYGGAAGYLEPGRSLSAGDRHVTVVRVRPHKNTTIVAFEGVTTRNQAEELRGHELHLPAAERRPMDENEYLIEDLIGLAVCSDTDALGRVVDVITGAVQDRLVVETPSGARVEVPFVDELVPEVSIEEGVVRVVPIEGLFG